MPTIREMAAYLFVTEFKEDENAEIDNTEAALNRARNFCLAIEKLVEWLPTLPETATEEEIQYVYYEVGKEFYGVEGPVLRQFFKDFYLLMFGSVNGPRLGIFTRLLGIDKTVERVQYRMNDLFSVRGYF